MKSTLLLAALVLAATPAAAQHEGHGGAPAPAAVTGWTSLPTVTAHMQGRMGAQIVTANSAAVEVSVVAPDTGTATTVALSDGKTTYKPAGGNYHLVSAVDACDTHVATASTAVYFANPGPAPTAILKQSRPGLAVTPERLPREHAAYRAGDAWRFVVTMDGQPFPGAKIRFETANGSRSETVSDIDGRVDVTFPDDFPPRDRRPPEAHGRPTTAEFVIAAIHQTGTVQHVGAFNYSYRPNAYDGMSLAAGAGFGVLGMALAAPFVRRRKGGAK